MNSILFKDNGELNSIIIDYYNYLLVNNFESEKSFDYIFYLLDNLNIYKDYVETLSFNNCLKSNGIYLSENKKIVINLSRINGCLNLGIKEKDEIVIAYLNLLFHEITHAYQKLYKENYNNEISEIFKLSEELKFLSNNDYELYSLFPDEINANLNSSVYLYKLIKNNKINYRIEEVEKMVIYYLTLGLANNDCFINSQLEYLCKCFKGFELGNKYSSLDKIDHLYLGLRKDDITYERLLNSYHTRKLCVDI